VHVDDRDSKEQEGRVVWTEGALKNLADCPLQMLDISVDEYHVGGTTEYKIPSSALTALVAKLGRNQQQGMTTAADRVHAKLWPTAA
jgi:hypothetical protein